MPFCKFHLGDRPIPVTFQRAIAALSFWQKVKLAWGLCFLSDPVRYGLGGQPGARGDGPCTAGPAGSVASSDPSKDDVERCKQKDLLEQMMAEMTGEFPDLHRTIVAERDIYLTHTLRQAARRLELPRISEGDRAGGASRMPGPRPPAPC